MKQQTPKKHVELINDNIEEFDKAIELFKQKTTLEEVAEKLFPNKMEEYDIFLIGARWQQERSYSEEEVIGFLADRERDLRLYDMVNNYEDTFKWFEQFKKK